MAAGNDPRIVDADRASLEVLTRDECLELLRTARIGRVAFHTGALPLILPVAFALEGNGIVIRVPAGSQLDSGTHDAVVAFEVDDADASQGSAWSVSVTGLTTDIVDADDLERVRALPLGQAPEEAGGERLVRVSLDLVTGRREPLPGAPSEPAVEVKGGVAGEPAGVSETHSGIVFFVGDRAYKLKKPVDLGFLDFRTRESRLAVCRREVALNRRLAPDVYLGVADVRGPDGRLCDHLVVMRRMPEDRRLSTMVVAGTPVVDHLARLARLLARFHSTAARSAAIDRAASRDAGAGRWQANANEMAPFRGAAVAPDVADELIALAHRYLAGRGPLFEARIAAGRALDGHGDLLADDIFCLDDGPRVLDCLEFDDALRFGDVLHDVAFLAMDLERLGRPDLAGRFLAEYRSASNDFWPPSLADHYIAHRAQIRAKVACVRWAQGDAASKETADGLLRLSLDHLRRARVRLVLVGGAPGTGKSTVAMGIAGPLGAAVLRSDEVRKQLAGVDPLTRVAAGLDEGIYGPAATEQTYAELLLRARTELGMGRTVVLDATWSHPHWRKAAACLAAETSTDLVELRCVAPVGVAAYRASRRLAQAADASDATEDVAWALAGRVGSWATAHPVDTSGDPVEAIAAALAHLDAAAPGRNDALVPPRGDRGPAHPVTLAPAGGLD